MGLCCFDLSDLALDKLLGASSVLHLVINYSFGWMSWLEGWRLITFNQFGDISGGFSCSF